MTEVIVLGDGPAGTAAAAALAQAGVATLLIGEGSEAPWTNRYGVWVDELARLELGHCLAETWGEALVYLDEDEPLALGRAYGRLDNARLRAHLLERFGRAGGERRVGRAERVVHDERGSVVTQADGARLRARLVLDATGHASRFVARAPGPAVAAQVAYGVKAEVRGVVAPAGAMVLMDFRAGHLSEAERRSPTFLYAMPLGGGRAFLEETSLVARPPAALPHLEARLAQRCAARGLALGAPEEVERCYIPMGTPGPRLDQRTVAWGAAAGMVHPATGYLVRDVLERAPRLAEAVAAALRGGSPDPAAAARAAWAEVWTRDRLRAWELYRYGMEVLLELDTAGVQRFFRAFFSLERAAWEGYLSGRVAPAALMGAMARVFARAPWGLRGQIASKSLGPGGLTLLRALLG